MCLFLVHILWLKCFTIVRILVCLFISVYTVNPESIMNYRIFSVSQTMSDISCVHHVYQFTTSRKQSTFALSLWLMFIRKILPKNKVLIKPPFEGNESVLLSFICYILVEWCVKLFRYIKHCEKFYITWIVVIWKYKKLSKYLRLKGRFSQIWEVSA